MQYDPVQPDEQVHVLGAEHLPPLLQGVTHVARNIWRL